MPEPLVRAVGLTRSYRRGSSTVHALRGVDLEVQEGEFVAIMGPSGSGKSTLMHLLGLLDKPTSGRQHFAGRDVSALETNAAAAIRNAEIGFVFQSFHLLPRRTALGNVALPLVYAGMRRHARLAAASVGLAGVGLADRADHHPHELSGGEQQRVAIARALIRDPKLVLADEPTGSLDSRTGAEILALLERVHGDGRTIIMVTHDEAVAGHARRIIRMQDGEIVGDECHR